MNWSKATFAAAIASAALLGGCHTITHYPDQPPMTTAGSIERSKVRFHAIADLDVLQARCMNHRRDQVFYACAYTYDDPTDPKRSLCVVYAFMPEGPEDTAKVALLGHEVWHCFGARHDTLAAASPR